MRNRKTNLKSMFPQCTEHNTRNCKLSPEEFNKLTDEMQKNSDRNELLRSISAEKSAKYVLR